MYSFIPYTISYETTFFLCFFAHLIIFQSMCKVAGVHTNDGAYARTHRLKVLYSIQKIWFALTLITKWLYSIKINILPSGCFRLSSTGCFRIDQKQQTIIMLRNTHNIALAHVDTCCELVLKVLRSFILYSFLLSNSGCYLYLMYI